METGTKVNNNIKGICMGSIYTHDYDRAYEFYVATLGLGDVGHMGQQACYIKINDSSGIYIEGGYEERPYDMKSTKASFSLDVESVSEMFERLKKEDLRLVHKEPVKMNETTYWFQCFDPVGNLLEFLGGK